MKLYSLKCGAALYVGKLPAECEQCGNTAGWADHHPECPKLLHNVFKCFHFYTYPFADLK